MLSCLRACTLISTVSRRSLSASSQEEYIRREQEFGAHNYHPLPVVIERGSGVFVWDTDQKRYYDFLSAYSAVNQGHCHPRIVAALVRQAERLTLTSRAFHNSRMADYLEYMTKLFGYDKLLPMNTGVEAAETAIKLARKWAYMKKGVPKDKARVIFCKNNFWGRTLAAISASSDPSAYEHYGPYMPGYDTVPYNDVAALERALSAGAAHTAAFMVEPVQGEAGVIVPHETYMREVAQLCARHNVLLIADEVQTGLGRTGHMLACAQEPSCRPDLLLLGKALSGGTLPVSACLCDAHIMDCMLPGTHGSTYGGSPLACRVALEAVRVIVEERLAERSHALGEQLRAQLRAALAHIECVHEIRGRGLMNALQLRAGADAWQVCLEMARQGLLAKPTHSSTIRLAPPLVITEEQVAECVHLISAAVKSVCA